VPDYLSFGRLDAQTFNSAQSLNVPFADTPAFLAQQRCDPPIAVARMLQRQILQSFP
jgi:hypothetical protein